MTDPGQNESMKGSLKMWSIFPVFPAVKQKCQVFTWLSWGLSYIYLFQFIIVFILWKGHNTTWLVQLITENNYILASCSILWVSLMWALLCLSMSRFRKSVHKSWTLTRGWARSCYFTSEIWERTRGSLMRIYVDSRWWKILQVYIVQLFIFYK